MQDLSIDSHIVLVILLTMFCRNIVDLLPTTVLATIPPTKLPSNKSIHSEKGIKDKMYADEEDVLLQQSLLSMYEKIQNIFIKRYPSK